MSEKTPYGRGLERIAESMKAAGIPSDLAQVLTDAIPSELDYDIHVLGNGADVPLGPVDPKVIKANERIFPSKKQ